MDDDLADTVITGRGRRIPSRPGEPGDLAGNASAIDEETVIGAVRRASFAPTAPRRAASGPVDREPGTAPSGGGAPARYRVRVNGGDAVPIDRVLLIGRAPRSPRVDDGSEPRLIAVSSPSREVSATHLELRQQGGAVVVTDLRSTNGTLVTLAGADRLALRPGESFVVGPGSIVDIGDGNLVEVLPVDRLVPVAGSDRMLP